MVKYSLTHPTCIFSTPIKATDLAPWRFEPWLPIRNSPKTLNRKPLYGPRLNFTLWTFFMMIHHWRLPKRLGKWTGSKTFALPRTNFIWAKPVDRMEQIDHHMTVKSLVLRNGWKAVATPGRLWVLQQTLRCHQEALCELIGLVLVWSWPSIR